MEYAQRTGARQLNNETTRKMAVVWRRAERCLRVAVVKQSSGIDRWRFNQAKLALKLINLRRVQRFWRLAYGGNSNIETII
jgi:hypothetical protein